jgi:hypothetical protein
LERYLKHSRKGLAAADKHFGGLREGKKLPPFDSHLTREITSLHIMDMFIQMYIYHATKGAAGFSKGNRPSPTAERKGGELRRPTTGFLNIPPAHHRRHLPTKHLVERRTKRVNRSAGGLPARSLPVSFLEFPDESRTALS